MNEQATKILSVRLEDLKPSPLNPRKHFDQKKIEEMAASMRDKGILQPLVVRPLDGGYEVVFGARRLKAAGAAGLTHAPVIVRDIDDQEVLELQIIENSQREDVHPLEEAQGYFSLSRMPGYDVAKIADRIGRSEKYVYDRLKLLSLITKAQDLFLKDKFTAGHAILLARLSPSQQETAIGPDTEALFQRERVGSNLLGEDENDPVKPRSVREFQEWIDTHVRFDREEIDTMLFPETASVLETAKEEAEKIVPITNAHYIQDSARAKERTIVPTSWKRADGQAGSKTCSHSVTGVFVVGPGRGEAMKVCIAKEKCKIHWGKWQKEREENAKAKAPGAKKSTDKSRADLERETKEAAARNKERMDRFNKSKPMICKAIAEICSGKAGCVWPKGQPGEMLIKEISGWKTPDTKRLVPRGKTSDDLVRYMTNIVLVRAMDNWNSHEEFPEFAKKVLGLDVWKLIDKKIPLKYDADVQAEKKKRKTKKDKVQEAFDHKRKAKREKKSGKDVI